MNTPTELKALRNLVTLLGFLNIEITKARGECSRLASKLTEDTESVEDLAAIDDALRTADDTINAAGMKMFNRLQEQNERDQR